MTIPGPKKSPVMQQIGSDVPFLEKTGPFVKHTLILYLAPAGASLCGFVSDDLVTLGCSLGLLARRRFFLAWAGSHLFHRSTETLYGLLR